MVAPPTVSQTSQYQPSAKKNATTDFPTGQSSGDIFLIEVHSSQMNLWPVAIKLASTVPDIPYNLNNQNMLIIISSQIMSLGAK